MQVKKLHKETSRLARWKSLGQDFVEWGGKNYMYCQAVVWFTFYTNILQYVTFIVEHSPGRKWTLASERWWIRDNAV